MDAQLGLVIERSIQAAGIKVEAHEIKSREKFPLSQSSASRATFPVAELPKRVTAVEVRRPGTSRNIFEFSQLRP
jgi:hypothetical protein